MGKSSKIVSETVEYGDGSLPNYSKLEPVFKILDEMDFVFPHMSYIIDYYKKEFLYINPKVTDYFPGQTVESMRKQWLSVYEDVLEQEDFSLMREMLFKAREKRLSFTVAERKNLCFSFDVMFKGQNGTRPFCVRHKYVPFLLVGGSLWLTFCNLSLSKSVQTGNAFMFLAGSKKCLRYDFSLSDWVETRLFDMSDTEHQVLKGVHQGLPDKIIADQLCLSVHTIDYHKRNILKKTCCSSMSEAVAMVRENSIL